MKRRNNKALGILKKIVVWIICLCLLLTLFAPAVGYIAFGADSSDFESYEDYAERENDYPYYEFTNIVDIKVGDDYFVVTELMNADTDSSYYQYVTFDFDGEFVSVQNQKVLYGDPYKIGVNKNTMISLNYLSDNSSMLYSIMMIDYSSASVGDINSMLSEDSSYYIRDFAIANGRVYYIQAGLFSSIKYRNLGSGNIVSTLSSEYDVTVSDLSDFSAIEACGDDIILQTAYTNLYHFDTDSGETTSLAFDFDGEVLQFGGVDSEVFVLTTSGLYYRDIDSSSDFQLILAVSDGESTNSNIIDPVSFATYKDGGVVKIMIADNQGAAAIKVFSLSGSSLSESFAVYSYSSSEDGYNTPTDVSVSYKTTVVADSENNRVKLIDDDGDVYIVNTVDENGDTVSPLYAGIDYSGNIYIATDDNEILVYSSSGKLETTIDSIDGTSIRRLKDLIVSPYDTSCYFLASSSVYFYNHNTGDISCVVESASGDSIAIDYVNNRVGVYDSNSMDVYSLATGELVYSETKLDKIGDLVCVEFDLNGDFYALSSSTGYSILSKYVLLTSDDDNYEEDEITFERMFASIYNDSPSLSSFAINFEEEIVYFLQDGVHMLFSSNDAFDDLEIGYDVTSDIPHDIFEVEEQEEVLILDVSQDGNRLLLPVSSKDDYYPSGYAIIRPIRLSEDSKVIVVSESEDGNYYYVIYNNSVGFMTKDALCESEGDFELPFEDALSLHDNAYIYKYPLTTTSANVPLYGFVQIEKDTELTILSLANDYICPMGMLWYRVEAIIDGETVVGYMPRYNVVENTDVTMEVYDYGRINANLFEGYAELYADEGETPLGKKIYDGEKVEIISESGDYYYVREADPTGSEASEGYVLKELVTTDSQTRSFTIAVILIIVLVISVGVIIFIKWKIKNRRNF